MDHYSEIRSTFTSLPLYCLLLLSGYGCDDDTPSSKMTAQDPFLPMEGGMPTQPEENGGGGVMGGDMQTMMNPNPNDLPRPTVTPSDAYEVVPCQDYVGQETEGLECAFLTLP